MAYSSNAPTDTTFFSRHVHVSDRGTHTDECISGFGETFWLSAEHTFFREAETKVACSLEERKAVAFFIVSASGWRLPHCDIKIIPQPSHPPPLRYLPHVRIYEPVGEQGHVSASRG